MFEDACDLCQKLDLAAHHLPRQKRPPQRFTGPAVQLLSNGRLLKNTSDRAQFYAVLDAATSCLQRRYDQPGIARYCDFERVLFETMTADKVHEAVKDYPELSSDSLLVQL